MTLKFGSLADKQEMFAFYRRTVQIMIDNILHLVYFMRGSIPYDQMLLTTPGERDRIDRFIERRLEQESKSPYPVY